METKTQISSYSLFNEAVLEQTLEIKSLRRDILHRLQKMGMDTTDWSVVNQFMRNPRIAGKTLGEMSISELQAFIPKISSILSKYQKKQKEISRLQQLN